MATEDKTVEQIVALSTKLQALQAEVVSVSAKREELVRRLRGKGWSLGQIATATGLSRGRIQQIVKAV